MSHRHRPERKRMHPFVQKRNDWAATAKPVVSGEYTRSASEKKRDLRIRGVVQRGRRQATGVIV